MQQVLSARGAASLLFCENKDVPAANNSAISSIVWFNGFAIGVEVQQGVAFTAFRSFAVSYN
jgi:hypothetical protein